MRDIAIVAAAGYKAVSDAVGGIGTRCPEPLMPIGDTTIVGRQAAQFAARGFTVFIAVGRPGCVFPYRVGEAVKRYGIVVHPDCSLKSPWTWARVEQVRGYGTPLLMPDPDSYSYHDSFCRSLDAIGYGWDRLIMSCGDHLYTDALLNDLKGLSVPCQVRPAPGTELTLFWLNPGAARLYRRLADEHRQPSKHGWNGRNSHSTGWSPEGAELAREVPLKYVEATFPGRSSAEFSRDADSPRAYHALCDKWLPLYG